MRAVRGDRHHRAIFTNRTNHTLRQTSDDIAAVDALRFRLTRLAAAGERVLLADDGLVRFREVQGDVDRARQQLRSRAHNSYFAIDAATLDRDTDDLVVAIDRAANALSGDPRASFITYRAALKPVGDALDAEAASLTQKLMAHRDESFERTTRVATRARWALALTAAVAILMCLAIGAGLMRTLARQGERTRDAADAATRTARSRNELLAASKSAKQSSVKLWLATHSSKPSSVGIEDGATVRIDAVWVTVRDLRFLASCKGGGSTIPGPITGELVTGRLVGLPESVKLALAAPTLGLEDEYLPLLCKHTLDPWSEGWATLIHHFVKPEIFPNWYMLNLDAQLGSHKRNDTIIVEKAKQLGIPVITRDRGVVQKAEARGAKAMTPEAFAEGVLPLRAARDLFFDRYDSRAPTWIIESVGSYLDREATRNQCETLRRWRIRYEYVWSSEPERYYLDTRHGELDL